MHGLELCVVKKGESAIIGEGVLRKNGYIDRMEDSIFVKRMHKGECIGNRRGYRPRKKSSSSVNDCLKKKES